MSTLPAEALNAILEKLSEHARRTLVVRRWDPGGSCKRASRSATHLNQLTFTNVPVKETYRVSRSRGVSP